MYVTKYCNYTCLKFQCCSFSTSNDQSGRKI